MNSNRQGFRRSMPDLLTELVYWSSCKSLSTDDQNSLLVLTVTLLGVFGSHVNQSINV